MSDALKIAFVVEGPTDYIVLKEIVREVLDGRDFVPQILKPEMSAAFKLIPGEDGGWPGVCRWCLQTKKQNGGHIRNNPLFNFYDILIIQLDADVAGFNYNDGHIKNPFPGQPTLPCNEPCPPAADTTNRLREIMLRWIGEQNIPPQTVLCTPSKALEAWVLVGLFPEDGQVQLGNIECRDHPDHILRGKPAKKRLVSGSKKNVEKYDTFASEIAANWEAIKGHCSEAIRFED